MEGKNKIITLRDIITSRCNPAFNFFKSFDKIIGGWDY